MGYLLTAFIIFVVLSPLFWLKQSPAQARMAAFRQRAFQSGVKVQLVASPEEEEQDPKPTTVRYLLPWTESESSGAGQPGHWTLIKAERRGWPAPWTGWRWFKSEAPETLHTCVGSLLATLPDSVKAVRVDRQGVSIYWPETGDRDQLDQVLAGLRRLNELVTA
ncbi:MAG: hypothetical protein CMK32_09180 [Porticoccaceae bacterium]|nr:hypothetical protein [Porticoccaceae bacterium]